MVADVPQDRTRRRHVGIPSARVVHLPSLGPPIQLQCARCDHRVLALAVRRFACSRRTSPRLAGRDVDHFPVAPCGPADLLAVITLRRAALSVLVEPAIATWQVVALLNSKRAVVVPAEA